MAPAEDQTEGLVLVVDDDLVVRAVVGKLLGEAGYTTQEAGTAAEALAAAASSSPDAVLLDLALPDADGLGLLPVLRDRVGPAPVLVLSGTDGPGYVRAALNGGAHDYVTKPWIDEVLLARVRAATRLGRTVRALSEANTELQRLASTDDLTGVLNRRAIRERLEALEGRAADEPFGVVLLDLDGFKALNDSQGHAAGDLALRRVAAALRDAAPADAVLGRWGGDEFLVALAGASPLHLRIAARNLQAAIGAAARGLAGSAGTALWEPGDSVDALVARADAELYADKRSRRG